MREIKFRFIYGSGGEVESYFHKDFNFAEIEAGCHFDEISDSPALRNYSILAKLQYTGLEDMYCVEIYEGDIVEQEKNCLFNDGRVVQLVAFDDKDQFVSGDFSLHQAVESFSARVVGNIYENPELLEVKK